MRQHRGRGSALAAALAAAAALAVRTAAAAGECQVCDNHNNGGVQSTIVAQRCNTQIWHDTGGFGQCCPRLDTTCQGEGSQCRHIATEGRYCDATVDSEACSDLGEGDRLILKVRFEQAQSSRCCLTCQAYGDPNTVSFDNTVDAWVLCDGRVYDEDHAGNCPITEGQCNTQRDHNNNPCKWLNPKQKNWPIALYGSPCQPDWSRGPKPVMTLYQADTFKLDLFLGERGIIQSILVTMGEAKYALDALDCDDKKAGPRASSAWTVSGSSTGLPTDGSFSVFAPNAIETEWSVHDPDTGMVVHLTCTKSIFNKVEGPPRINIQELVEPLLDYQARRENVAGSCATGLIEDKSGTTDHTDTVHKKCVERALDDDLLFAKAMCQEAISQPQVAKCISMWCDTKAGDNSQCLQEVATNLRTTYCRAAAIAHNLVHDTFEERRFLLECQSVIAEFGWKSAVAQFGDGRIHDDGTDTGGCIASQDKLPASLVDCEDGITVTYQKSPGEWVPLFAIPAARGLCEDVVTISADKYPELFTHEIRFEQCAPDSSCRLTRNACSVLTPAEVGFRFTSPIHEPWYQAELNNLECVPHPDFEGTRLAKTWCLDPANIEQGIGKRLCPCNDQDKYCD